jgi:hypothetical protein
MQPYADLPRNELLLLESRARIEVGQGMEYGTWTSSESRGTAIYGQLTFKSPYLFHRWEDIELVKSK